MKKILTPNTLCHSTASLKGKSVTCDAISGVKRAVWSESELGSVGELFFSIYVFGFVFVSLKDLSHFRERIEIPDTGGTAARKHPVVKNYFQLYNYSKSLVNT